MYRFCVGILSNKRSHVPRSAVIWSEWSSFNWVRSGVKRFDTILSLPRVLSNTVKSDSQEIVCEHCSQNDLCVECIR